MRVFNFGAGPATLPEQILLTAQQDGFNWRGLGMSVMEVSHRSPEFVELLEETRQLFFELLNIPNNYQVLFIGSPARFHFGTIPMNFLKNSADYVVSGTWSKMAAAEAAKLGKINIAGSNAENDYLCMPKKMSFNPDADYCYFTPNETLSGLKIPTLIDRPIQVPLIADMTSCLFSEPLNISDYAMIIAGAQKNLAPSGLSVAIINDAFLDTGAGGQLPSFFDYQLHAQKASNYATPPTFNIYMANLMLKWLKAQGGVSEIAAVNKQKASSLYQVIDELDFYQCPIAPEDRSEMNVIFRLKDETLNQQFLDEAKKEGLVALKGHRSVGGMRASIYNAMPLEGALKLADFMTNFVCRVID